MTATAIPSRTSAPANKFRQWARIRSLLPGAPALLFLLIAFIGPVLGLLLRGFTEPEPGLGNFATLFGNTTYAMVLFNTFLVASLVTAFSLLLGFPVAWLMAMAPGRIGKLVFAVVLLSMWTNLLARTYAWLILLQRTGPINRILMEIGAIDAPIVMVNNLAGVVIGMTYIMIPFIVLPLHATMTAIDPTVLQAASVSGARPSAVFFRVFLPLTKSGLGAGCLMVFVMSLGYYVTPAILGGPQNMMLPQFIVQQVQTYLNWGIGSAGALILLVVTALLFIPYVRWQRDNAAL